MSETLTETATDVEPVTETEPDLFGMPVEFTAGHEKMLMEIHGAIMGMSQAVAGLMPAIQSNPMLKSIFGL